MPRDVRDTKRADCVAAVTHHAHTIGNTVVPDDTALVGFDEYVRRVEQLRPDLGASQRYEIARAVERRQPQPEGQVDEQHFGLPMNVGGDQQAMTMVSSFDNCVLKQIPAEQARRQEELAVMRREVYGPRGRSKRR